MTGPLVPVPGSVVPVVLAPVEPPPLVEPVGSSVVEDDPAPPVELAVELLDAVEVVVSEVPPPGPQAAAKERRRGPAIKKSGVRRMAGAWRKTRPTASAGSVDGGARTALPCAGMPSDSFLRACRGERPERTPIWLMRQAGRYLPEYREVRARVSFEELCRRPDLCAEVTVQPIDRLDVDAAILFSDILVVFDALGVEVRFEPSPVIAAPVRCEADLARLRWADPREALAYVYEAVRACKAALAGRVPLIGFCGAPFTTLSYLVEGKTSREFEAIKGMMFSQPGLFGQMMDRLTTLLGEYLRGQVEAGADALQIFDSWAGALAPDDYREHVLPHTARLCAVARELGVPVILFARGNANLLSLAAELPADVLGVDWSIELDRAIDVVGAHRVVQGNLDPLALLGPAALVERKARAIVRAGMRARAHIFNLGHGISRHTDPAIARLLVDVVHAS